MLNPNGLHLLKSWQNKKNANEFSFLKWCFFPDSITIISLRLEDNTVKIFDGNGRKRSTMNESDKPTKESNTNKKSIPPSLLEVRRIQAIYEKHGHTSTDKTQESVGQTSLIFSKEPKKDSKKQD